MRFPAETPSNSPLALAAMQHYLLGAMQARVGIRRRDTQIFSPVFSEDGPHIRLCTGGGYAVLSPRAAQHWPAAVIELAHETVHLLDPEAGYTNYFEEGIGVAFEVEMALMLTDYDRSASIRGAYEVAWRTVSALPGGAYSAASSVRQRCGALRGLSYAEAVLLFPRHDTDELEVLVSTCVPRAMRDPAFGGPP